MKCYGMDKDVELLMWDPFTVAEFLNTKVYSQPGANSRLLKKTYKDNYNVQVNQKEFGYLQFNWGRENRVSQSGSCTVCGDKGTSSVWICPTLPNQKKFRIVPF